MQQTADDTPWVEGRGSSIHRKGLFAIRRIPAETRMIE
jgi:hypothetical protein